MTAHASWATPRSESYERLAFLGDSLLSQIITLHLYSSFSKETDTAGVLTRMRAQLVADASLRVAAERIGLDRMAVEAAPVSERENAERLVGTGKPLSSMFEALIAACWIEFGPEQTSRAVIETLRNEILAARDEPADEKSLLQEELARHGDSVRYEASKASGPPHKPVFQAVAIRVSDGTQLGEGSGSSKKAAERQAAAMALSFLVGEGG